MTKSITLEEMTKIEGHAVLSLSVSDGTSSTAICAQSRGSRYFEGLLVDRLYDEAYWIASRI